MSALSIIFVVFIICAEISFFTVLFCNEIADWLKAKSDEIRAKAESLRNANPAYNVGYNKGYMDGKIDGMKASAREEDSGIPDKPEGSE